MKRLAGFFLTLQLLAVTLFAGTAEEPLALSARFDEEAQRVVITIENRTKKKQSYYPGFERDDYLGTEGITVILKRSQGDTEQSRPISPLEVVSDTIKLPVKMRSLRGQETIVRSSAAVHFLRDLQEIKEFQDGCVVRFQVRVSTDPHLKHDITTQSEWLLVSGDRTKLVAIPTAASSESETKAKAPTTAFSSHAAAH